MDKAPTRKQAKRRGVFLIGTFIFSICLSSVRYIAVPIQRNKRLLKREWFSR